MSFTKIGKTFQNGQGNSNLTFAEAVAHAVIADFGASPRGVKKVAKLTATSERTVRNWLDGTNGPSGENLVILMRHSDAVLSATLMLAGRTPLETSKRLATIRQQLSMILAAIDSDASPG